MMKYLKISVSSLVLAAFVAAPVATFVTADAAYAKSENGGGKGNSGSNGNGGGKGGERGDSDKAGQGKDKSANGKANDAKNSGNKSAGKAKADRSLKGSMQALKSDLGKLGSNAKNGFGLFGGKQQDKVKRAEARASVKAASPAKSARPPSKGLTHPSNLGKMNGILNSSAQAKLAHIANGNFNGPIGAAAALALADYNYDLIREDYAAAMGTLDLAEAYGLFNVASEEELAAARADNDLADAVVARDILADPSATEAEKVAAQQRLDAYESDYGPLADDAVAAETTQLSEALRQVETGAQPTDQEVAQASQTVAAGLETIEAVENAERTVLGTYKGDLAASEIERVLSEEEVEILGRVRASLPLAEDVAKVLEGQPQPAATEDATLEEDDVVVAQPIPTEG